MHADAFMERELRIKVGDEYAEMSICSSVDLPSIKGNEKMYNF